MNINDLQIEKEIAPLFDYTLNDYAKSTLLEILETPLKTKEEIINRQSIFKGLTFNYKILKQYKYSVSYLNEIHHFLETYNFEDIETIKVRYKLFTPSLEKIRLQNKLTQLVLLFNKLNSNYFSRLNLSPFPQKFKKSIETLNGLFADLNIKFFAQKIQEGKFKTKDIISLVGKIQLLKSNNQIANFWDNLFLFEAYLSINIGNITNDFVFPEISNNTIDLKGLYFPLIKNPIRNNFSTSSNVIVLTGPNMSGKSTFLKAIGLCMYLTQLGLAIPATQGKLPFCSHISVSINHTDDVKNGYSHFMTELINLKNIATIAQKGESCFAVFDELFSGTNVEDALEILTHSINGLSKQTNSIFIISTHIPQLKNRLKLSAAQLEAYYIDCQMDNNQPKFTYQLRKGWSELRIGKLLYDNIGLNKLLK